MTLNATYVNKNFALSQVAFDTVSQGECTVDLTDCKEELLLLLDTAGCGADVTVTVAPGDYASAKLIPAFTVPRGGVEMIPVSTGEVMQADGCMHLTFGSCDGLKAAVLKKRYVTNH